MNNKWYIRPIFYPQASMAILLILALLLSLTVLVVPSATTEADINPNVVWVDDDFTAGSCGGHTWHYNAFNSTQDGIDGVANNGTVHVAEGDYTGFYIMERSGISVVGTEEPIINYPPVYEEELLPCLACISDSTDITIEGFEFQCPVIEPMAPSGFGAFSEPFVFPLVAGIGCVNSTGTISSVTVKDMVTPVPEEVLAAGIYVIGGLIEDTVTIYDSTTENCTIGVLALADHVILDSCRISGVTTEDYGSWGIFAGLAIVDMLNCNVNGCHGGWEGIFTTPQGFGQPDTVFGSSGIITLLAGLRMNGCVISNNDIGACILTVEDFMLQSSGNFNSYATGRLQLDQGSFTNGEPSLSDFLSTTANLNNIAGNTYFGVISGSNGTALDATNNWWGSVNGPELFEPGFNYTGYNMLPEFGNGAETGDIVVGNITYQPWLGAPLSLPAVHRQNLPAGEGQVVDASEETDTTVTITTSGATNITVASYESQPFPGEEFPDTTLGKYIDIYISNPEVVSWPVHIELAYTHAELVTAGVEESTLGLYYYAPDGSIQRCSDTGVNSVYNFIWANITETEAGSLVGSPFATGGDPYTIGGEAYPVNRVDLVMPLIAMGMAAVVAGNAIAWRRYKPAG
jgi:hypothetical protein